MVNSKYTKDCIENVWNTLKCFAKNKNKMISVESILNMGHSFPSDHASNIDLHQICSYLAWGLFLPQKQRIQSLVTFGPPPRPWHPPLFLRFLKNLIFKMHFAKRKVYKKWTFGYAYLKIFWRRIEWRTQNLRTVLPDMKILRFKF